MTQVRTSPYYPQSNGKRERWHQSAKTECLRPQTPQSLEEAARFAVCCGSLACTVDEVIPSLPARAEVDRILATLEKARPAG